jgi:Co/Zn/Cd efflux system component
MTGCGCEVEIKDASQKKVLLFLLAINAAMFVFELSVGWHAQSTGLIADSMDMLADAIVYGIGLYAIGKTAQHKSRAAMSSGWFQMVIGLLILADILRRVFYGSEPVSLLMMGMGFVALIANVYCLALIQQHKDGDVHMRASWVFSKNDVIANIGVIFGGILVWLLDSRWPDLIIGGIISLIILNGARHIIIDARNQFTTDQENTCKRQTNTK